MPERSRGIPASYYPPDLEDVPKLSELVKTGHATVVERTKQGMPSVYRATPEGQEIIYAAMARNAARQRERRSNANEDGAPSIDDQ